MKMTTEVVTLAEAEEDIDDEDEEDTDQDEDGGSSEICTFDVPHFRYIDEDDVEEEREGGWRNGSGRTWYTASSEEDYCDSSSYRYVVVSGTPLKILEHLLSDLRLDDQRGAPESRESGKFVHTHTRAHAHTHTHTEFSCTPIKDGLVLVEGISNTEVSGKVYSSMNKAAEMFVSAVRSKEQFKLRHFPPSQSEEFHFLCHETSSNKAQPGPFL